MSVDDIPGPWDKRKGPDGRPASLSSCGLGASPFNDVQHFYVVNTLLAAKTPQDAMMGRLINAHTVTIYRRAGIHNATQVLCVHLEGDDPKPGHVGVILCDGLDRVARK